MEDGSFVSSLTNLFDASRRLNTCLRPSKVCLSAVCIFFGVVVRRSSSFVVVVVVVFVASAAVTVVVVKNFLWTSKRNSATVRFGFARPLSQQQADVFAAKLLGRRQQNAHGEEKVSFINARATCFFHHKRNPVHTTRTGRIKCTRHLGRAHHFTRRSYQFIPDEFSTNP